MRLTPLVVLWLCTPALAQLGAWTPSPTRADVWFSYGGTRGGNPPFVRWNVEEQYPGLDVQLASIVDAQEESLVRNMPPGTVQGILIGLTDFHVEGEFRWLDGTRVTYTNWGPGYPGLSTPERYDFVWLRDNLGFQWQDIGYTGNISDLGSAWVMHSGDCNGSGVPDLWEIYHTPALDMNGNGVSRTLTPPHMVSDIALVTIGLI